MVAHHAGEGGDFHSLKTSREASRLHAQVRKSSKQDVSPSTAAAAPQSTRVTFPEVLVLDEVIDKNPIRQIGQLSVTRAGTLPTYSGKGVRGHLFRSEDSGDEVLILPGRQIPDGYSKVLRTPVDISSGVVDLSAGLWRRHPLAGQATVRDRSAVIAEVVKSWAGAFTYLEEDSARGIAGLRRPQLGALHAVHAHWAISEAPATIVMPTGTGKTEVMLSVLVTEWPSRLLGCV